jgi:GNAT superfamily N-acetyltransferase
MENIKITKEKCPSKNSILFYIKEEKTYAGLCSIQNINETTILLREIIIYDQFRNKGYGAKLLNYVVEYLRKKNKYEKISGVFCPEDGQSENLKKWYYNNGFELNGKMIEYYF